MSKTILETPFKSPLEIKRYPFNPQDLLQGWESADELILEHLKDVELQGKRILIINDQFGALSGALSDFKPTSYTDSYVSARGIELNTKGAIQPVSRLDDLEGSYDLVLLKFPKNMSFLEDILCRLSSRLGPGAQIICGAMVKHLAKSSFDLLEEHIGKTSTSLAQKKARLIFARFEKTPKASPYPLSVKLDGFSEAFVNHSNLFSREKLDIGTRFLLEHMPQGEFQEILDLGCANGVVGIRAQELNPRAKLTFTDESQMAVQSAKANYEKRFSQGARFLWTNCYEDQAPESLDLVLCNPPFHQQMTVGDFIAWQMFTDAHKTLKKGGVLRVIGNSHLGYQVKLKKLFGHSQIIATNQKFMIVDAVKR